MKKQKGWEISRKERGQEEKRWGWKGESLVVEMGRKGRKKGSKRRDWSKMRMRRKL